MKPPVLSQTIFSALATVLIGIIGQTASGATILDPGDAPGVTDQMYRDLGAAYPEVGQVAGSGFAGSGTLIGGKWVLTAGHVAFAKTGGTFSVSGQNYTVLRALTYPGWGFGSDLNDIGLLELTSSVIGVTPAVMVSLTDDSVLMGQRTTWVGFGQSGTGLTGATTPPGVKRGFTNNIDGFGPTLGLVTTSMFTDFDRPDGSKNSVAGSDPFPTALEGNVAPGDSGGAVFLDGVGLVGVISYRGRLTADPFSNSDYGELSGASRLNQFTTWITQQTGIVPIPEPSGAALVLFAGICALRRRR